MYTVLWTQSASDQLADAWLNADPAKRREITNYVRELETYLGADAPRIGESRDAGVRISVAEPLGIDFHVSESDRLVTVLRAWRIRSRS